MYRCVLLNTISTSNLDISTIIFSPHSRFMKTMGYILLIFEAVMQKLSRDVINQHDGDFVNCINATVVMNVFKEYTEEGSSPPNYLIAGARALSVSLKSWTQRKDVSIS